MGRVIYRNYRKLAITTSYSHSWPFATSTRPPSRHRQRPSTYACKLLARSKGRSCFNLHQLDCTNTAQCLQCLPSCRLVEMELCRTDWQTCCLLLPLDSWCWVQLCTRNQSRCGRSILIEHLHPGLMALTRTYHLPNLLAKSATRWSVAALLVA